MKLRTRAQRLAATHFASIGHRKCPHNDNQHQPYSSAQSKFCSIALLYTARTTAAYQARSNSHLHTKNYSTPSFDSRGIMFWGSPSVCAHVRPSVHHVLVIALSQEPLIISLQTLVMYVSCRANERIRFGVTMSQGSLCMQE